MTIEKKAAKEARHQAQDLAYQAMESRDPNLVVRLCTRALELDPRCVDALIMMIGSFDDPVERARRLAQVVRIAEEDLGGESYLEENRGHFWGRLETRPYMRARSYLAQALHKSGKLYEAMAQYEAMLALNPNDNQGLRYALIGLYLEGDNLEGVRRLQAEYGDDASAAFAWSAVLERFLSDDRAGAQQALSEARAANPYFEGYLLGSRPMPATLPGYYGFGDQNEAIICVEEIGVAWQEHPRALGWLRTHQAPAEAGKIKVGRNDPCPCGSGKKYKKCCLNRESAPSGQASNPVAAEMALNEMHQAMEGKEFSSMEELQAFIQEFNQQRNQRPLDNFEGLSPEQMHRLINFPFDSPEVVEFPCLLKVPPAGPMVTLFELLVEAIGEDGLKPTATGNLPLKVVREVAHTALGEEKYKRFTRFAGINSEVDFPLLHVTRITAEFAGLIRKYKGRFVQSKNCRKLLKDGAMSAVYPALLRSLARKFNWACNDRYPELGFIQSFFAFTLYLLVRHGEQWREKTFYEDAFLRAFPSVVDSISPTAYETREDIVRQVYSLRCLQRFAEFLGLIEIDLDKEDRYVQIFKLRKTPLLDSAVVFREFGGQTT